MKNLAELIVYFLIDISFSIYYNSAQPPFQASLSLPALATGSAFLSPGVSSASQPEQAHGNKGHLQSAAHA